MTPGDKGLVLGVIAAAAGAAAVATYFALEGRDPYGPLWGITTLASMPAAGIGAVLGRVAVRLTSFRRVILVALGLAPIAAVEWWDGRTFLLYAAIPTVVLALGLEYWTRSTTAQVAVASRVTVAEWPARVP